MVFGTPMTWVFMPEVTKCSARSAAFVLESSPPMMTMESSFIFLATAMDAAICSGVSILVRPLPMMSNPPVLRYSSMNLSLISTDLPSMRPEGPPRKP